MTVGVLTFEEASYRLGIDVPAVEFLVLRGTLPVQTNGGVPYVHEKDVERLATRREPTPKVPRASRSTPKPRGRKRGGQWGAHVPQPMEHAIACALLDGIPKEFIAAKAGVSYEQVRTVRRGLRALDRARGERAEEKQA